MDHTGPNPMLGRLDEESRSKSNGKIPANGQILEPSGYELASKIEHFEPGFGPVFGFERAISEIETRIGLEKLRDEKIIYGTSFCRADSKEIIQTAYVTSALRTYGPIDTSAAYFIDPNSHSLAEYLDAIAQDYQISKEDLQNAFRTNLANGKTDPYAQIGSARDFSLPPAYYDIPNKDQIEALPLPDQVKEIWISTLDLMTSPDYKGKVTFGNWIVEINRVETKLLLEKLGYPSDLIHVYSLDDIVDAYEETDIQQISADVSEAAKTYYPKITAIAKGQDGQLPEVDNQNSNGELGMFCLIGQDGRKILITQKFEPVIFEGSHRRYLSTQPIPEHFSGEPFETYRQICKEISGLTFEEAQQRYPVQPSGVGYYRILGEKIQTRATVIADDYERARGPYSMMAFVKERFGFSSISTPKGLIGSNGNYNIPPDLGLLLTADEKNTDKLKAMMDEMIRQFIEDDISCFTGASVTYNAETKDIAIRVDKTDRHMALMLQKLGEKFIAANPTFSSRRVRSDQFVSERNRKSISTLIRFNPYAVTEAVKGDARYEFIPLKARNAVYLASLCTKFDSDVNLGESLGEQLGISVEYRQAVEHWEEFRLMYMEKHIAQSKRESLVGTAQLVQNEVTALQQYMHEFANIDFSETSNIFELRRQLVNVLINRNLEQVTRDLGERLKSDYIYEHASDVLTQLEMAHTAINTLDAGEEAPDVVEIFKSVMPGLLAGEMYKTPDGIQVLKQAITRHQIYVLQRQLIVLGVLSQDATENILEYYSIATDDETKRLRELKSSLEKDFRKRITDLAKAKTREEQETKIAPLIVEINESTIPAHNLQEYQKIGEELSKIKIRLSELSECLGEFSEQFTEAWVCRSQQVLQNGTSI